MTKEQMKALKQLLPILQRLEFSSISLYQFCKKKFFIIRDDYGISSLLVDYCGYEKKDLFTISDLTTEDIKNGLLLTIRTSTPIISYDERYKLENIEIFRTLISEDWIKFNKSKLEESFIL